MKNANATEQPGARRGTAADDLWREVLRRNTDLVREHGRWINPTYLDGLNSLALPARVPRAEDLNLRLEPTGWRVVSVDGYLPSPTYAGLVARGIFPVSRVMRRAEHIDFSPMPDMIHDVLGHLPMLFSPEFRDYLKRLASVMESAIPNALDEELYEAVRRMAELKSERASRREEVSAAESRVNRVGLALLDSASEVTALRRVYVWSVEFGLLGDPGDFRVHGAALLSAPAEFRAIRAGKAQTTRYSLDVLRHENAFSEMLTQYFVARDFAQYGAVLAEYEATMRGRTSAGAGGGPGRA